MKYHVFCKTEGSKDANNLNKYWEVDIRIWTKLKDFLKLHQISKSNATHKTLFLKNLKHYQELPYITSNAAYFIHSLYQIH